MSSSATSRFPTVPLAKVKLERNDIDANDAAPLTTISDKELMARIREDDKDALAVLFQRYSRLVLRVARKIIRDETEGEDVVQEVFLFLYAKRSVYDSSKSSPVSWIVQIAYQKAIQRVRYLTSRRFYTHADLEGKAAQIVDSTTTKHDYSAEAVLGRTGLKKVFEDLSEDQRETLKLHFFEGYTLREISVRIGQPLANVRHHYYRGLARFRSGVFGDRTPKS